MPFRVRRYTRQLLEAVACLHEHGVVHRDIKVCLQSFLIPLVLNFLDHGIFLLDKKIYIHSAGCKHLSDGGVEDLEVGRLWVRGQDQGAHNNAWRAAGK